MRDQRRLVGAYLAAKDRVIAAGYEREIRWQESRQLGTLTESEFLSETAWVIVAAGFSDIVVRQVFPRLSAAFLDWHSAQAISDQSARCRRVALRGFNNPRKVDAIVSIARSVAVSGFDAVVAEIRHSGVSYLEGLPYVGPVTSRHLAKNIGVPIAKPDRHLSRIAAAFRYASVDELCADIAAALQENPGVVDLVLWRDATQTPAYLQQLLEDYWSAAES